MMKRLVYLMTILILFQSCYSYKKFDFTNYELKKSNKFRIHLDNSKKIKGKIIAINNKGIHLKLRNKIFKFSYSSIIKIEKRKFSFWKTGATVTGFLVLTMAYAVTHISFGNGGDWNWNWR